MVIVSDVLAKEIAQDQKDEAPNDGHIVGNQSLDTGISRTVVFYSYCPLSPMNYFLYPQLKFTFPGPLTVFLRVLLFAIPKMLYRFFTKLLCCLLSLISKSTNISSPLALFDFSLVSKVMIFPCCEFGLRLPPHMDDPTYAIWRYYSISLAFLANQIREIASLPS